MTSPRGRKWFVLFLVLSFAASLAMLLAWRAHAQLPAAPARAAMTPSSADTRTIPYRVEQLEWGMAKMHEQHDRITWLLLANLAGGSGSLATYILTNRRRFIQRGGPQ